MPTPHRIRIARLAGGSAVCLALVGATLSCSSNDDSAAEKADAAYVAVKNAGSVFDCSTAFDDLDAAHVANDVAGQQAAALKYRELLAKWDGIVSTISFPEQSKDEAEKVLQANDEELAALDAMASAKTPDEARVVVWRIFVDDWNGLVLLDDLKASLDQTPSPAQRAGHQLALARSRSASVDAEQGPKFAAAVASGDLAAAKAANDTDIKALQTYLDQIGAIDFPADVKAQVDRLKQDVQAEIAYDQKQVAVANTAEIVLAPPGGSTEALAEAQAHEELQKALADMNTADPAPNCPAP